MHSHGDQLRFHLRRLQRHPVYLGTKSALRTGRQLLPNLLRHATYRYRALPGAVIVGAGKAGTTQLYSYMVRHPRCFGARTKEIHYFSNHSERPLAWYQSQFPLRRRMAAVGGLCIEASPSYLPSAIALRRMANVLPRIKVIALLRDPVTRAFSQYQHEKTRRREQRPFAEIVHEAVAGRERPPQYVARGFYSQHLEALFDVYPREQVLVIDSAELFTDTNAVCQQVFAFLGVEPFDVQPEKIYNRGLYRETIDPASAGLLREHYRPYDERLVQLLGRTFSWMQAPATRKSAA